MPVVYNVCIDCIIRKYRVNKMKKRILELCFKIAMREGVKCDAYFSNIHYSKFKVTIRYGEDLYHFKTYRKALEFLES